MKAVGTPGGSEGCWSPFALLYFPRGKWQPRGSPLVPSYAGLWNELMKVKCFLYLSMWPSLAFFASLGSWSFSIFSGAFPELFLFIDSCWNVVLWGDKLQGPQVCHLVDMLSLALFSISYPCPSKKFLYIFSFGF